MSFALSTNGFSTIDANIADSVSEKEMRSVHRSVQNVTQALHMTSGCGMFSMKNWIVKLIYLTQKTITNLALLS